MAWTDEDPTQQLPTPTFAEPVRVGRRRDGITVALAILLTFALGTIIMLTTTYSLTSTIDRLMSVPICREVK